MNRPGLDPVAVRMPVSSCWVLVKGIQAATTSLLKSFAINGLKLTGLFKYQGVSEFILDSVPSPWNLIGRDLTVIPITQSIFRSYLQIRRDWRGVQHMSLSKPIQKEKFDEK